MSVRMSERDGYTVMVSELDEPAARRLLTRSAYGRVSFDDGTGPVILPVNHAVWQGDVVIRTDRGSVLDRLTDDRPVAFEVDHIDQVRQAGWSVLVRGHMVGIDHPVELDMVAELDLHPWAAGEHDRWLRLVTEQVTARMVERHRLHRPDLPSLSPD